MHGTESEREDEFKPFPFGMAFVYAMVFWSIVGVAVLGVFML